MASIFPSELTIQKNITALKHPDCEGQQSLQRTRSSFSELLEQDIQSSEEKPARKEESIQRIEERIRFKKDVNPRITANVVVSVQYLSVRYRRRA